MPATVGEAPVPALTEGQEAYQQVLHATGSQQAADEFKAQETARMVAAGQPMGGITQYWGDEAPDDPGVNKVISNNLQRNMPVAAPQVGQNPIEAFKAGFDNSDTGLLLHKPVFDANGNLSAPTPQGASLFNKIMAGTGQAIGDFPAAVTGFVAGGLGGAGAGAAVPVGGETGVTEAGGAVLGAGFGGAATPEAMRQAIILAYRKGTYKTSADFLAAVGSATVTTMKQGVVGAAANLVGGPIVGKAVGAGAEAVLGPVAGKVIGGGADAVAQAATAATVGAALDGRIPNADDFVSGAVIALGLHTANMVGGKLIVTPGARAVQKNLQDVYVSTGIPPWEAVKMAKADPHLMQELTTQDVDGEPVSPTFKQQAPAEPAPYGGPENGSAAWAQRRLELSGPGTERLVEMTRALENSGDTAVSPKGAVGRFQIMPATARQYGYDPARLMDPEYAHEAASGILSSLNLKYHGDEAAVLTAYNAGPRRANALQQAGPGTRLDAVPDKRFNGGLRYELAPAGRNEAFLPLETQKYLARMRMNAGSADLPTGAMPGSPEALAKGLLGEPPWSKKAEAAQPPKEPPQEPPEGPGGGGGDEEEPFPDLRSAYDKVGEIIGEPLPQESQANPNRLYRQMISELGPGRQLDDRLAQFGYNRDKDMGVEDMARQTYGSDTRAAAMIRWGQVDPATMSLNKDTPSFFSAAKMVKDAGGNLDDWTKYMLAKRTLDLNARKINSGVDLAASQRIVPDPDARAKYEAATVELNKSFEGVLRYAQGKGLYTKEQVDTMLAAGPTYLSMNRIMKEFNGQKGGNTFTPRQLAKIKGSNRQITDPIESTLWNIHRIVANADRNALVGYIVNLAETKMIPTDLGVEKVAEEPMAGEGERGAIGDNGGPPMDAENIMNAEPALKSDPESRTFTFFRNGMKETWQTSDPALADLLRRADSPGEANLFMSVAEKFAGIQRLGIAGAADFPLRIMIRHQVQAFLADPLHPPPFITWMRGAADSLQLSDAYKDWAVKGGAGSALHDMDVNYLQRDIAGVFEKTNTFGAMLNTVTHPLEALRLVMSRMDAATRIGYTKRATDMGLDPLKAATMSRTAYIDYSEKGTLALMNQWAKIVPFFRPHLLGVAQLGKAWAAKPVSTTLYTMAGITIPAVALHVLNTLQDQATGPDAIPEDRKYKNIPRWEKDTMFVLPEVNGVRLKIPMPPVVGTMFGGLPLRMLDHFQENDPHAYDEWGKAFIDQLLPNIIPSEFVPSLETMTNYNFFNGKPLVPASLQDRTPDMQYTPNTTAPAKALAQVLGSRVGLGVWNTSPIAIEDYVRNWTGTLGLTALKLLNAPLKDPGPPGELADIPFVSSFIVRHPGATAQPIEDFYTAEDAFKRAHADYDAALKEEAAGVGSADADLDSTSNDIRSFVKIAEFSKALQLQNSVLQGVYQDKTMTVDEKRQRIEQTYIDMIETAKSGLSLMDSFSKGNDVSDEAGPN